MPPRQFSVNTTNHQQPLSPPPSATFWNSNTNSQIFNTPIINGTVAQSSIFATPQSPPQNYQFVYNYSTPTMYQQQQSQLFNNQTPSQTAPANETFEAKWARLQANKKQTNPFAEDIAKKYEIKL